MTADVATLGIDALLDAYAHGDTNPVEVLAASRARIAAYDETLNAIVTVIAERADRAAEEAARRWAAGTPRPLEGIPFGVKDVFDVSGERTTAGSRLHADRIATQTATVVRRVEAAGAVLVAKEGTTEFAIGGPWNPLNGPVRNPWDTARWSGGSSSGSAAALAARYYPISIGSDAGGSIRIPSAWCGLTGLKPTHGAVPRTGAVPLSPTTETVGPMSRSAADTARLFQIIRGQDRRDPRSQPYPTQGRDAVWPPKNVTVGIPDTFFFEVCDDAVRAGYDAFVDVLRQAGAQTKHVRLPSAELAQTVGYQVLFTEAAVTHAEHASRLKDYDPVLVQRMHAGLLTSAADYLRALQFRHELQLELSDVFRDVDVIALPAAPSTAPNLDELTVNINGRKFPLYEAQSRSTMLCNLSGVPGLVLPTGLDEGGCPTSVQLVAPPFREDVALTLALGFQELTDSHCALPPLLERETAS
ncbi:Amidase (plasmid) [Pseudonocardia dioxanivorans CB1190]|uniref:Amidase n=1 Tax=Pseudonocardia dioxanivorans (strain ATCC 55486 / DSM 44775 / JCM 13855 / CB1190) TaxID=675635 RepID=F2L6T7_PSEUX|nr:amidase [Pseudonocardia dioxanivorans]AEA28809.1 Amidase [Pseudonocardia dioxanivorans CB1190]GJF03547.1 amidase [Pseudonocardia sp. D17]